MRFRVKHIFFLLICFVQLVIHAQKELILAWNDSSHKYRETDFIRSKFYADTAIAAAKKTGDNYLMAGATNALGNSYLNNGNYDLALEQFNLAETYAGKSGKRQLLAKIIGNQALCYERKGNYKKAFDRHFRALVIRQELNIPYDIALNYQNMAATYFYIGDLNASINATQKAIAIIEKEDHPGFLSDLYSNLAVAYFNQYKDSLTLKAYMKALELARIANDKNSEASVYLNLVSFYNETGQYAKALESLNKTKAIESYFSHEKNLDININTGTTYMNLNRPDSALFYYDRSLEMAKQLGFTRKITEVYNLLYEFHKKKGDFEKALQYRDRFYALNDSVAGEKNLKNVAELEAIYKTEKKNREIEQLNAENKIQREKTENNKKLLLVSLAGLLLAIVAAFAFYRNFVNKKKDNVLLQEKNSEIQKQKDLIAEKNKEIIDSITYAKRLQHAILPSVEQIQAQLPQSFVLYKPKDIVAGDFYWMFSSNEKAESSMQVEVKTDKLPSANCLLLAVADCTGHGVPGAMVSVVCANALNAAVKEFKLTEPAKILDKVNELVEETFGKNTSDVKDGMDISLVKIELINDYPENKLQKGKLIIPKGQTLSDVREANKKYRIQWAGANNPLWYVQEGEWKEIKADKQPVGKFDNRKPFTNHEIQLKVNDSLYLISDGYADQFGGEAGKKIKNKALKEMLFKNSNQSPEQQKAILDKEFSKWQGHFEQVDDVTILGIRL